MLYGMAVLRLYAAAVVENVVISTVVYLIASQVG